MIRALLCLLLISANNAAEALDCADADPAGVTAKVYGNYELLADPDDPAGNVIYVNHVSNGPSSIVVARVNGVTGKVEPGTLRTVAENFQGQQAVNGPEFVDPPGSGLGILYRNLQGVHGVFRPVVPKTWDDFRLAIDGRPSTKNPPALPSTYPRSYDAGNQPLGQNTYALIQEPCSARCFANLRSGVPTDAAAVFRTYKLYYQSRDSIAQGGQDGDVVAVLCSRPGDTSNKDCGLYAATIDDLGGFTAAPTFLKKLPTYIGQRSPDYSMDIGVHPVSKANIIFVNASHESGQTVDVYQQANDFSPPIAIASIPARDNSHYRIRSSGQIMIMNYLVRSGNQKGSYIITVSYSPTQGYTVSNPRKLTDTSNGDDVVYFPAAKHFAIIYRTSRRPSRLERCFFDP